jgi:hypothetical protein
MFSAIRSGDYYMFEELDDDVLDEKDETSSDDEGGKHDGERRVTLSKVRSFLVEVLVKNRDSMTCLCVWHKKCLKINTQVVSKLYHSLNHFLH